MAGKITGIEVAYAIAADNVNPDNGLNEVPMFRILVYGDKPGECKLPTGAAGETFLGTNANDQRLQDQRMGGGGPQAGKHLAVMRSGSSYVKLTEDCPKAGTKLTFVAGGFAKPASSTDPVIGIAEQAGKAGEYISFWIAPQY